jgi:signal peptidase complex subunit 1
MDYKGQELSENLFFWIIIVFGAIGWIYGYVHQDFTYVFYAWCVGMIISIVVRLLSFIA